MWWYSIADAPFYASVAYSIPPLEGASAIGSPCQPVIKQAANAADSYRTNKFPVFFCQYRLQEGLPQMTRQLLFFIV